MGPALYLRGSTAAQEMKQWLNTDPNDPYNTGRCRKCGLERTPEGHDPCIANLPGVMFACCGHGTQPGYVMFENGQCLRGLFDEKGTGRSHPLIWKLWEFMDEKLSLSVRLSKRPKSTRPRSKNTGARARARNKKSSVVPSA